MKSSCQRVDCGVAIGGMVVGSWAESVMRGRAFWKDTLSKGCEDCEDCLVLIRSCHTVKQG